MSSVTATSAAATAAVAADDVLVVLASGPSGAPLRLRWLPSSSITIADLLSKLPATVTHVRYADPEGDVCTVRSDAELAAAIECAAVPNGRGVGGRPRRVLRVSYDVAADVPKAVDEPKAVGVPKAPAAASPKAPAALAALAARKAPAAASPKAPAAASPKAPAAASPKAPAALAAPKGLAKGRANKDAAHHAEKLARLQERAEIIKEKLATSKDAPTSVRLAERLAAVNAKILHLRNVVQATAPVAPADAPATVPLATLTPAIATLTPAASESAPAAKPRPAGRPGLKAENLEALLARNAARAAAVEQKTAELLAAAEAARLAGNLKRAAMMDAAVARSRQQSAKIAERRAFLLTSLANLSPAPVADTLVASAADAAATPTADAPSKTATTPAAAAEVSAVSAPLPVVIPAAPLCGLGSISPEQRQAWLSAQHTSVLAEISMLATTIATVRANGHPRRAEALAKRMANLQERAARLEQRRAFVAAKHAKHAEQKAESTDQNAKPAVVPLTVLTAARPVVRGRGKPQFVAHHQLAKLKERRALIDARIAELEAEVAAAH